MSTSRAPRSRLAVAVAACSALLSCALPQTMAAPGFDDRGYLDSAARCTPPDVAAEFGSTADSRVAICKSADGRYQYRGVRLRDGAKLVVPATLSGGVVFVAENNGISYAVSPSELVISSGPQVIRREPMIDFHKPGAPAPTTTTTTVPSTAPASTTPSPAPTTANAPPAQTPETAPPPTPLPPPLPAEVGGGR